MRISNRTLIYVTCIGLVILFGCGAPAATSPAAGYPTSESQPAATEPFLPEPTESSAPEATPSAVPALTAQPAMPERRRLTLEFPPEIRAGDSDVVRLTLEVDDLGNITPTAEIGGHEVTGQVIEIPNVYETHRVIVEARFDIAGMEISPSGLVSQPLTQGISATFRWSIRPRDVGDYRGTIWLSLRFVDKSSGEESQKTVSAQIVDIQAVNFLGLSGAFARTTGVVGSVVGTILGLPFLEEILKFFFKRRPGRVK
jgi:hypothetical protein